MERVLRGTSATISVTFYVDGVATAPSPATATIAIEREDGTTLVASMSAAPAGTGVFTFALTPTHTAQLDQLTAKWTATFGGQPQTIETLVEVVGGFHFSLAQAKKALPNATTADLVAYRALAEQAVEDAFEIAFVPRYARERFDGDGSRELLLRPRPQSIESVTVAGTALSGPELAALVLYPSGVLKRPTAWPCGDGNIEVKYTHGHATAPLRLGLGTLELLKRRLSSSATIDPRTTKVTIEGGTMEFGAMEQQVFDVPELAALESVYSARVRVG